MFFFIISVCPGQFMADAIVWLTLATILATAKISKATNEEGNEIIPEGQYTGDTVTCVSSVLHVNSWFN